MELWKFTLNTKSNLMIVINYTYAIYSIFQINKYYVSMTDLTLTLMKWWISMNWTDDTLVEPKLDTECFLMDCMICNYFLCLLPLTIWISPIHIYLTSMRKYQFLSLKSSISYTILKNFPELNPILQPVNIHYNYMQLL